MEEFNEEIEEIRAIILQYEDDIDQELNFKRNNPEAVDMYNAELFKALELLQEVEDEAKKMNSKDYYFDNVVHRLFQQFKPTVKDIANNRT